MSDRGYSGGSPDDSAHDFAGKTVPGKTAATGGFGGLYPYIGIPGGGVIAPHVTTLSPAGVIAANGGATEGPTAADDGNNCLPASRLLPDSNVCTGSTSGAGGGVTRVIACSRSFTACTHAIGC